MGLSVDISGLRDTVWGPFETTMGKCLVKRIHRGIWCIWNGHLLSKILSGAASPGDGVQGP